MALRREHVKLFISWSGGLSHKVALILRDWVPSVIQSINPYVSSEDIDKGARWSTDISEELAGSQFGLIVVTRSNLNAPWLNFEAGALSKSFDSARVSPFLFGIKRSDVEGPLLQFQSTTYDRDDILKLMSSLNQACDGAQLEQQRLEEVVAVWWPMLEEKLNELLAEAEADAALPAVAGTRDEGAILEEILDLVRSQQRLLNSPEEILPSGYLDMIFRQSRFDDLTGHPVIEDLEHSYEELRAQMQTIPEAEFLIDARRSVERLGGPIGFIVQRFDGPRSRRWHS